MYTRLGVLFYYYYFKTFNIGLSEVGERRREKLILFCGPSSSLPFSFHIYIYIYNFIQ